MDHVLVEEEETRQLLKDLVAAIQPNLGVEGWQGKFGKGEDEIRKGQEPARSNPSLFSSNPPLSPPYRRDRPWTSGELY